MFPSLELIVQLGFPPPLTGISVKKIEFLAASLRAVLNVGTGMKLGPKE